MSECFAQNRQSIRLQNYDYQQDGAYFVTCCVFNRASLFGKIANGQMILSRFGIIVQEEWENTQQLRAQVSLDAYIVMPDHFHAIVWIGGRGTACRARMMMPPGERMKSKSKKGLYGFFKC